MDKASGTFDKQWKLPSVDDGMLTAFLTVGSDERQEWAWA